MFLKDDFMADAHSAVFISQDEEASVLLENEKNNVIKKWHCTKSLGSQKLDKIIIGVGSAI